MHFLCHFRGLNHTVTILFYFSTLLHYFISNDFFPSSTDTAFPLPLLFFYMPNKLKLSCSHPEGQTMPPWLKHADFKLVFQTTSVQCSSTFE